MASDCARVYERLESSKTTGFLDLSQCKLTQIPNGVFMVMKSARSEEDPPITKCSLANNLLKTFPSKIIKENKLFGDLECLDLSGNRLSQLPSEIEAMKKLKDISLAGNSFEYLPEIIWDLPDMQRVNLAENSISNLEVERIRKVETLKCLVLSGNPLADDVREALVGLAEERRFLLSLT